MSGTGTNYFGECWVEVNGPVGGPFGVPIRGRFVGGRERFRDVGGTERKTFTSAAVRAKLKSVRGPIEGP